MDPHASVQAFYDPNIVGSLLDLDTHKDAANRTSTVDTARVRLVRVSTVFEATPYGARKEPV